MPTQYDNDLLREGIMHFRAKEFETARKFIERALEVADDMPTRAQANYYLSLLAGDPVEKRKYLEETLAIDGSYAEARRALAILDGRLKAGDLVNADALPASASGLVEVQADRFICPKCGGRMVYSPDGASLICEYCSQHEHLSTLAGSAVQDFFIAMANGTGQRSPVAVQIFKCQGCGASFVLAPQDVSAVCAWCGSAHVVALQEKREMVEPDSLLPVAFDRKQAAQYLVEWVKEKKLTLQVQVSAPRGLYLPVWTFDIQGSIPWHGTLYRNKRQVPVSGDKIVQFNDVRILGSQKMAGLLVQALPEFDLSVATAYDARFLAGWMADVYDLPMADASLEARRISVEHVRDMIYAEFGRVQDLGYSTAGLMVNDFRLILVPVWVTELKTHDRAGRVLINGQTGSVHSELPVDGFSGWLENTLGGK